MSEIMEHQKLSSIVDNYNVAQDEIRRAFELLISAKERLNATIGGGHIFPREIRDYNLDRAAEECNKHIQRNTWRYLLNQVQVRAYLSSSRKAELDSRIEKNDLPEITVENVLATLETIRENLGSLLEEAVKEVFDFLRPGPYSHHKTNLKYSVGEKVIISYAVESWGYLNSRKEQDIRSLDTVMHMLDGKGAPKYPDDLVTRLSQAIRDKEQNISTEYFDCKWFKKAGTLHLRFKRSDLLKELNRIGGNDAGHIGEQE